MRVYFCPLSILFLFTQVNKKTASSAVVNMSWLSGIAKGAEALLDRVDQTAASALQIDDLSPLSGDTSDLVGRASNPASSATNQSQPDKQFVASSTLPDRSVKSVSGEIICIIPYHL